MTILNHNPFSNAVNRVDHAVLIECPKRWVGTADTEMELAQILAYLYRESIFSSHHCGVPQGSSLGLGSFSDRRPSSVSTYGVIVDFVLNRKNKLQIKRKQNNNNAQHGGNYVL